MIRAFLAAALLLVIATFSTGDDKPRAKPSGAVKHPMLEKVKGLAGTWVEADKDGKPTNKVVSVIKVIGAGSTVHETLFPGQPHEMVSLYHLDKGDLVMTHYCCLGNQPRMKADPKSPRGQIRWLFAGGTNLDPAKDKHMHDATVKFIDDDTIEITGSCWEGGKPCTGKDAGCNLKLVRKK